MTSGLKIVAVSDTHGRHWDMHIPRGDVFVHAGDFSPLVGTLEEIADFDAFLGTLPHRHKIVVAGNHDMSLERDPERARAALTNAHYLEDEGLEIENVRFYGSPWQPQYLDWAFNLARGAALRERWAAIPDDTDVLITHGPPFGIGDETVDGRVVGCEDLLARVRVVKPRLHVFGHIHEGRGRYGVGETLFLNASSERDGREPFVVTL